MSQWARGGAAYEPEEGQTPNGPSDPGPGRGRELLQDAGRNTAYDCILGNIPVHDGTGPNDGIVANSDARDDERIPTDPDIVADAHWCLGYTVSTDDSMARGVENARILGDLDVVANGHTDGVMIATSATCPAQARAWGGSQERFRQARAGRKRRRSSTIEVTRN